MRSIGRPSQHDRGVGSIIGAVFVALIILSGLTFYALTQGITQDYNTMMSSMSDMDWNRNQENIVIKQIAITSTNKLNVTAENDGPVQSHLIWLGIFNKTATPEKQTYQALNEYVRPGEIDKVVSNFAVISGNVYVVQLVTELGNVVESSFYPAEEPAGFSTKATFYDLIQNYPFGGAPTTMKPNDIGASTCLVYPFEIDRNITVTAIYIRSNVAVSNCLLIGIYDSTGTRLYVSSALSTVATGWIAITGISATLASGTYYFGTTNNNQNVAGGNAAYTVTPSIGTATLPRWGSVPTSNGAMPVSIIPASITETAGGWMCYVLLSSVTS